MLMYVADLINDFLEHIEIERGRSLKTVENYGLYLARFLEIGSEFLPEGAEMKPSDITPELLRKYRLRLNRVSSGSDQQRLSVITQSYHLIALRGFLKYLARRGIKSMDPSLIDLPKATRKQVTFLYYNEVQAMLEEIPLDTENGLRDRAIVELLFSGGLRVSELVNLNRDMVNLDRREGALEQKENKIEQKNYIERYNNKD